MKPRSLMSARALAPASLPSTSLAKPLSISLPRTSSSASRNLAQSGSEATTMRATSSSMEKSSPARWCSSSSMKRNSTPGLSSRVCAAPIVSCSRLALSLACIIFRRSLGASQEISAGCRASVPSRGKDLYGSTRHSQTSSAGGRKMMWPSEMDFSSSISQLGTPGMLGLGFSRDSSSSDSKEMPSAAASALTLSISFWRISSEIREIRSIFSNFCSYIWRFRY
mmetsp:Transcript_24131/g.57199  ORF Transcript_24131/g.57199 Transcript_24131/m.57199 type:complete len:224 (+) Transcript_24131:120-791(+)